MAWDPTPDMAPVKDYLHTVPPAATPRHDRIWQTCLVTTTSGRLPQPPPPPAAALATAASIRPWPTPATTASGQRAWSPLHRVVAPGHHRIWPPPPATTASPIRPLPPLHPNATPNQHPDSIGIIVMTCVSLGSGRIILMEVVNAIVLKRTRDLAAAIRDAKVDYEWRIHQLEHKIEIANRDLNEAREMIVDLEASMSLSSALVKKRDKSIMWMRTVIVLLVMAWYFISRSCGSGG